MNKLLQSKKSGFVMVLMLLVVVILFVIGLGLLGLGRQSRMLAVRNVSELAARCSADAGLTKAVFEMNEKLELKPWDDIALPSAINETLPNCNEVFSYTVAGDSSSYTIESIGKSGQAERTVSCVLRLQGPFEAAIFADSSICLKNSARVDGYNYGDDGETLKIGTNSTEPDSIELKNAVTIDGDVVVGAGGDPDVVIDSGWSRITGGTYALTERYELQSVTVPEYLQNLPSQDTISNSTTITSSGKYDSIDLANAKTITIDGSVALYITGNVELKNAARLQIVDADTNPDASLTLYVGGDFVVKNAGVINNRTQDPKKLGIYGLDSCENMQFANATSFYGTIYAPKADVVLCNAADVYGAVVANNFEQKNAGAVHYDASLRDVNIDDECVRFAVERWHEE
jgi:hypothetical protein